MQLWIYNLKNLRQLQCEEDILSVLGMCKETLHTEKYLRFNTQHANELQEENKRTRATITQKVNAADEMKIESTSLITKIKELKNNELINLLEDEYNILCDSIKQTEQEITELNVRIAENDEEILKSVKQTYFGKMEKLALYKEKLYKGKKVVKLS